MPPPVALVNGRLARVRGPPVTGRLAGQEGLEPPTAGFGDRDSSQLSYCPVLAKTLLHYLGLLRHCFTTWQLPQARSRSLTEHHQICKCTLPTAFPSNHDVDCQAAVSVADGASCP